VNNLRIEPTLVGKTASAFQFILIGLVLLMINLTDSFTPPGYFLLFIAFLTVVSGLQYIFKGLNLVNSDTGTG
jgi:phosphatidylglycerophosphate synthase